MSFFVLKVECSLTQYWNLFFKWEHRSGSQAHLPHNHPTRFFRKEPNEFNNNLLGHVLDTKGVCRRFIRELPTITLTVSGEKTTAH